jgi:hypothetical protein
MIDRCADRDPATGEETHLSVDRVGGPGGQLWWRVQLLRTDGQLSAVVGQMAIVYVTTQEQAREMYRERLRALRLTEWVRVG